MVLKNEKDKLNFIVDTLCSIGFEYKGASFAVHKLAFEIASRGHNVYIFNEPFYPHENITVIPTVKNTKDSGWWAEFNWEPFTYNQENTISIYTQITWGNPFGTTNNCRWVLNDYDNQQWETYGKDDLIYNYGSFKTPDGVKQEKLTVFDYKLDIFKNKNKERKGVCSIIHKFTPSWGHDFIKQFDSKDLTDLLFDGKFYELAEEFNNFETLITFDIKSYITTAAALCGCKVVLLNTDKNITPLEYRIKNPIQMCGVAYGWEDVEWAETTLPLVRKNINNLQEIDKKTIESFIKNWENKLII